jgi:hypothetical protein
MGYSLLGTAGEILRRDEWLVRHSEAKPEVSRVNGKRPGAERSHGNIHENGNVPFKKGAEDAASGYPPWFRVSAAIDVLSSPRSPCFLWFEGFRLKMRWKSKVSG